MVSTPTRPTKRTPSKPTAHPLTPLGRVRTWFSSFWEGVEGHDAAKNGSTYYLILGSTIALTAIGIMMVLSASSVEAIAQGQSPFAAAMKQGVIAIAGFAVMFILSRVNVMWLKRLAWPGIIGSYVLLALVLVIGNSVNGNRNWIDIAGFSLQPSEAAKLALALWMATVLATKAKLLDRWMHVVIPVIPVAGGIIGLVLIGNDLGTGMIIMMIMAAALFFAGVPMRMFALAGVVLIIGTLAMALTSSNRMCRITSWWTGAACGDGSDTNYQSTNGLGGLASGGWFGVGLGQSRQKYSWIPEAHNDFIFAIIGEELGLIGALVVVALFAILGISIYRVVIRQEDLFHRVLAGTIMVWILGQGTINMAVVTSLIPVIGVPLPFISYGGSALLMSLAAIGVVLSLAREQMGASNKLKSPKFLKSAQTGSKNARPGTTKRVGIGSNKPNMVSRPSPRKRS
ncbi:putative lipid II flippase FtsW [Pseudarthrobacter sp. J1738]|uniref:putative lipid II flippase FtsW n=1 Tax=unclassified Pseudarthrobacter TaxID=2647000 RepID=UPI003D2C0883